MEPKQPLNGSQPPPKQFLKHTIPSRHDPFQCHVADEGPLSVPRSNALLTELVMSGALALLAEELRSAVDGEDVDLQAEMALTVALFRYHGRGHAKGSRSRAFHRSAPRGMSLLALDLLVITAWKQMVRDSPQDLVDLEMPERLACKFLTS